MRGVCWQSEGEVGRGDCFRQRFCTRILQRHLTQVLHSFPTCVDISRRGDNGKRSSVLVHCASGKGRSLCVVLAYLVRAEGLSLASAYELVQTKRPIVTNLVDWRHRNLSPQGIVLSQFALRQSGKEKEKD